ncbi:MAG: hypothetical protein WD054_06005, partial [Gemmatimonadota bacterium]
MMKRTATTDAEMQSATAGDWLDQIPAAAAVFAEDGTPLRWNADAGRLFGWSTGPVPRQGAGHGNWFGRLRRAVEKEGRGSLVLSRRRGRIRTAVKVEACPAGDGAIIAIFHDYTAPVQARHAGREAVTASRQAATGLQATHQ